MTRKKKSSLAKQSLPAPILLQQESIQDLICVVCTAIPLDPVITPCDHIFCNTCIEKCLVHKLECPIDRIPLDKSQIKPLSGIARRLWAAIVVSCPVTNCLWSGSVCNFSSHAEICAANSSETDEQRLSKQIVDTQKHCENLQLQLVRTSERLVHTRKALINLQRLSYNYSALQQMDCGIDDSLQIAELTRLIGRNLGRRPDVFESTCIYDQVRLVYASYLGDMADPPDDNLEADVKTLLAVCNATEHWFSEKQANNIRAWLNNI